MDHREEVDRLLALELKPWDELRLAGQLFVSSDQEFERLERTGEGEGFCVPRERIDGDGHPIARPQPQPAPAALKAHWDALYDRAVARGS
jgi:hypothetical protein